MKNLLLLILVSLAFLFASPAFAQKAAQQASDSFQLGSRKVFIPAPEGFAEIFTRFDRIAGRLIATEDPNNESLTAHLPISALPKFEVNQDQDLGFYTKVSVSKRAKTVDCTPEMFAQLVSTMETQMDTYLDPNGPLLKSIEANTGKGLSELWGKETTVELNQPKHLGVFDKGPNIFSSMLFMNIDMSGKKYSILGGSSLVRINQRLVFVYTYKMNPAGDDLAMLRAFTKKWTAAILAANK